MTSYNTENEQNVNGIIEEITAPENIDIDATGEMVLVHQTDLVNMNLSA